jgi:hypothetical protein
MRIATDGIGRALQVVFAAVASLAAMGCGSDPVAPTADASSVPVARTIPLAGTSAREFFSALGQSGAGLQGGGYATAWNVGAFPAVQVAVQLLRPDGSALLPRTVSSSPPIRRTRTRTP